MSSHKEYAEYSFTRCGRIFKNADRFQSSSHQISNFPPIHELRRISFDIFKMLEEDDQETARNIKYLVWRLKSTVEYSILPFSNEYLSLKSQIERLKNEVVFYPPIFNSFERIEKIVEWLVDNPENPKQKKILEILNASSNWKHVGIVFRPTKGRIPGWDENAWKSFCSDMHFCRRISSASDLKKQLYDLIIVPSGGKACPFARELFTTFMSPRIEFLHYRSEPLFTPVQKTPPGGTSVMKTAHKKLSERKPHVSKDETWKLDEWTENNFWQKLRKETLDIPADGDDTGGQFLISARLALLGREKAAYLRSDHKVIEISGLVEGRIDIDEFGHKLPRKAVHHLTPGDVIVLRTSGSGDYLDEVSQKLMQKDDREELLGIPRLWKISLREALLSHGSVTIAKLLEEKGSSIRDENYIWNWSTDLIIRPESKELFKNLISVLVDLGFSLPYSGSRSYATATWEDMGELVRYRMKAGMEIRRALLERLKTFIEMGTKVEDEQRFSLPGVSAGEISMFRINDVDNEDVLVPYPKAGRIIKLME